MDAAQARRSGAGRAVRTLGVERRQPGGGDPVGSALGTAAGRNTADVEPSQQSLVRRESGHLGDGRMRLTMNVCHDWALRSWILSWGPFARVVSPAPLARAIRADLDAAGTHYRSS